MPQDPQGLACQYKMKIVLPTKLLECSAEPNCRGRRCVLDVITPNQTLEEGNIVPNQTTVWVSVVSSQTSVLSGKSQQQATRMAPGQIKNYILRVRALPWANGGKLNFSVGG